MNSKLPTSISILACLVLLVTDCLSASAQVFEREGEKLKASKIQAKGHVRGIRPMLGIPELSFNTQAYSHNQRSDEPEVLLTNAICGIQYGERISYEKGVWLSQNQDFGILNWIALDFDPLSSTDGRDKLSEFIPKDKICFNANLWKSVLDECAKWAAEKPVGGTSIACGPLIYGPELSKGKDAMPYEFFLVVCKKTRDGLGYKSIGFLVPNRPDASGPIYNFSQCVNLIEHKSGYDFFPGLPDGIEENVEGMTTYELFCSYIEDEAYHDDPSEREEDWMDAMSDYLEDFRDR